MTPVKRKPQAVRQFIFYIIIIAPFLAMGILKISTGNSHAVDKQ
jgi:hypothetical protein